MKTCCSINTPIGKLWIKEESGFITQLTTEKLCDESEETPVLLTARQQIEEYFANTRREFDLPLCPKGTVFQKKVWEQLCKIPYGETRSYGQIAAAIGNAKASRAVGMANHYNPIMIVIPCHRVIGSNKSLTGYAGGIEMKQALLHHENADR